MDNLQEVKGKYVKTIYRNCKNGYTKFLFSSQTYGDIKCEGMIPRYAEKTPLNLLGHYEETKKGEIIFFVQNSSFSFNNRAMIKSFLCNNMCPGVGTVTADAITDVLIHNFEEKIASDKIIEELGSIKGLDNDKAAVIVAKIRANLIIKKIYEELYPYGGNYKDAETLYNLFYNDVLKKMQDTPYQCAISAGLPFGMIDAYAKNHGKKYYDDSRIKYIVSNAFFQIESTGNTYLHLEEMIRIIRRIETTEGVFDKLIPDDLLILELTQSPNGYVENYKGEICFYSKKLWEAECAVAQLVNRKIKQSQPFLSESKITQTINKERELDETQKQCYRILEKTGFAIITGGPGVGKTSTTKKILDFVEREYPDKKISLCAPTGRAAENMMEASGRTATTVHILLEYQSLYGEDIKPGRNHMNPLDSDIVVVDEFSMVDIVLFSKLLDAMKENSLLIMIGDINQLKSVGPGKVLDDLISSNLIPVYRLTKIHRQAEGNSIIENSIRITNMRTDLITDKSFHILRFPNTREMLETYKNLMQGYYDSDNYLEIQGLSVMKDGECGVKNANHVAQDILSDHTNEKFYYGEELFYIGDKVMTTKNNYEDGYMNGDIGILDNFTPNEAYVEMKSYKTTVPMDRMEDLSLAYTITVHKSQGSEARRIILMLPSDAPAGLLENAIAYVGITRAKEEVFVLSEGDALERAILNKKKCERKTGLLRKLAV